MNSFKHIDYVVSEKAYRNCWINGILKEMCNEKLKDSFINIINAMKEYNNGLLKTAGNIHFIKNNIHKLCLCHVPMFGNIKICDEYLYKNIEEIIPNVFEVIDDMKTFNKAYNNLFTIEKRLYNRYNVGYKKFKQEVEKLLKSQKID